MVGLSCQFCQTERCYKCFLMVCSLCFLIWLSKSTRKKLVIFVIFCIFLEKGKRIRQNYMIAPHPILPIYRQAYLLLRRVHSSHLISKYYIFRSVFLSDMNRKCFEICEWHKWSAKLGTIPKNIDNLRGVRVGPEWPQCGWWCPLIPPEWWALCGHDLSSLRGSLPTAAHPSMHYNANCPPT